MHHLNLAKVLACFVWFALAIASSLPYPLLDSKLISWVGEIDGHEYELNGTIHDVMAQLKERYPEISLDATPSARPILQARNKVQPPLCIPVAGQPWARTWVTAIYNGINTLNNANNRLRVPFQYCIRPYCDAFQTAIYVCNDNPSPFDIFPASRYLASYAEDIINMCSVGDQAGGQEFDTDGYNVIVRQDDCQG